MRKVFDQHVCNNLCYCYDRPHPLSEADQKPKQENGRRKITINDDDDEDEADEGLFIAPSSDPKSVDDFRQRSGSTSSHDGDDDDHNDDDVFRTNSATELRVMLESADLSNGGHGNAGFGFHHKVFSLGKGEETSDDLAYCCTDLSKSVIEEIEEEQRRAEEKRAEHDSSGKLSDHDFFRRIHLGDQIKSEGEMSRQTKAFDSDGLLHRCNVQAVGGIEKRPSI